MRIAIDLDGTAWKHREFFKEFCWAMSDRNHDIYILTAHSPDYQLKDLELWNSRGFPPPALYLCKQDPQQLIGDFKRKAIKEHQIDILFDDFGGNNPAIENTFMSDQELDFIVFKVYPGED